uniref:Mcm6 C-terminal winged-helix domain-containing protein n=1 Tax=Plectus sambesii TaxID=2011161 RepID=A0A914XJT7_9BILA
MNVGQEDGNVEIIEDGEGQRIQSEFQRFLEEFRDDKNKLCYLEGTRELLNPERNTLLGRGSFRVQVVTVDHVREASKLLNKSIVRVEQPDIALDEDDDDELIADADAPPPAGQDEDEPMDGDEPSKRSEAPIVDASKLRLTFEQYKKLSDMIVLRIRSVEETRQGKADDAGVHQSELVDWYLEMIEETVESEVELRTQKTIVERVIRRLVAEDGVLIELSAEQVEGQPHADPILVVHPNYAATKKAELSAKEALDEHLNRLKEQLVASSYLPDNMAVLQVQHDKLRAYTSQLEAKVAEMKSKVDTAKTEKHSEELKRKECEKKFRKEIDAVHAFVGGSVVDKLKLSANALRLLKADVNQLRQIAHSTNRQCSIEFLSARAHLQQMVATFAAYKCSRKTNVQMCPKENGNPPRDPRKRRM